MISKLLADLRGIAQVCGPGTAAKWLGQVALTLPEALRTRNLMDADLRMGRGPFKVRRDGVSALLHGEKVFTGLREIWVRECYSKHGFLRIPEGGTVVDLGANLGNFTMMALAANPTARVIAVEPGRDFCRSIEEVARINGFGDRLELCNAFVGLFTDVQTRDEAGDPQYRGTPALAEKDFLDRYGIERIDFLKCDIEGSEYFMLSPESRLLDTTDRLAIELHLTGGRPEDLLALIERKGFKIQAIDWMAGECVALATRE